MNPDQHAPPTLAARLWLPGLLLALAALAWLAAGAAPAAAVSAPAGWQPAAPWATALAQATITPIATGLGTPTGITHAGDGSGRIFIVEQPGRIRIYDGTQLLPTPFLDVSGLVTSGGERGLLGLAFHPNYTGNGYFFVNYTDSAGDTVVARYTVSANPNVADAGSALIALRVDQPFANHNGGQLQFGPDGYLYVGLGDGGSAGDPGNRAQNLGLLLGKILRLDVDGGGLPPDCDAGGQYTIPADNPFVATAGACGEIWAYGLRNPWRFSFDRASGDLYIADVGQSAWEEIDFQPASSAGGANYGWRLMEGFSCYNPSTNCNDGSLTLPVVVYPHTAGLCSITGGYVYRGSAAPGAAGAYIFGDYCTGQIAATRQDGAGSWQTSIIRDTNLGISSFGETESGELCVGDGFGGAVYCLFP